jgi:hypothetical protein
MRGSRPEIVARTAERIHVDGAGIERLNAMAERLPDEARVRLTMVDGSEVTCTVVTRPILQSFLDREGREGFNAVLRIDSLSQPVQTRSLWLDEVARVQSLPMDDATDEAAS